MTTRRIHFSSSLQHDPARQCDAIHFLESAAVFPCRPPKFAEKPCCPGRINHRSGLGPESRDSFLPPIAKRAIHSRIIDIPETAGVKNAGHIRPLQLFSNRSEEKGPVMAGAHALPKKVRVTLMPVPYRMARRASRMAAIPSVSMKWLKPFR